MYVLESHFANLPPFTQQQKALVKFVFFTCHMVWKPHVPVSWQCWSVVFWSCPVTCLETTTLSSSCSCYILIISHALFVCVHACVLSIYLSSSLLKLNFIYFPHLNKVTNCSICVALQASFTAVLLVNNGPGNCHWLLAPNRWWWIYFFYYKVKTVLFVSSGPKPCEACRQEEIYEEPISILNSNEVSYEVCIFFFFASIVPSWDIFLTTTLFHRKLCDYSLTEFPSLQTPTMQPVMSICYDN